MQNTEFEQQLLDAGLTKSVYALVIPEAEQILKETLSPIFKPDAEPKEKYLTLSLYREAWTKKQDSIHLEFLSAWQDWVKPVLLLGNRFKFCYPTSGASEGLFHLIADYGNFARQGMFAPTIHIFEGEYEGYQAYAESQSIPIRKHVRSAWQTSLDKIGPYDQVYISTPSAIDGNLWPDFNSFMISLYDRQPTAQVIVDVTYVGSVTRNYKICAAYTNVKAVVFSLSKPMGVYYHRIGGVLAKEEIKSLYGNQWFKNLQSLCYGTKLLRNLDVQTLPRKYQQLQNQQIMAASEKLQLPLKPSDVLIIGTVPAAMCENHMIKLIRAINDPEVPARLCLTPGMAKLIKYES